VAKPRGNQRNQQTADPGGLWHQPALMNLLADVLIVLAAAGLAWAVLTALQRLPVFPLRELVLDAAPRQVSLEQIEHAARSAVVGNFFTVDLEAAQTAFEKLPWVRKVAVRRQWPDGLSVTLEEHRAVARWRQLNGDQALVNAQGEIFVAERPAGAPHLPQLSGPEGSAPEILMRYAEFNGVLAGIGRHIETVALTPRRAWQLKLDDGVAIELGRDQGEHPLGERLERFAAYYPKLRERVGAVRVADMRYPNGFVLSGLADGVRPVRKESVGRKS
jgi:cell division protein FtsQ